MASHKSLASSRKGYGVGASSAFMPCSSDKGEATGHEITPSERLVQRQDSGSTLGVRCGTHGKDGVRRGVLECPRLVEELQEVLEGLQGNGAEAVPEATAVITREPLAAGGGGQAGWWLPRRQWSAA